MTVNDLTLKIAGEAGQGVESTGRGFTKALVRGGLFVFGLQDYHSRIRGGHNFYQIRVADHDLHSHNERVHLLLPMNKVAVDEHLREIVPQGGVVYDPALEPEGPLQGELDESALVARSVQAFPIPLLQIATEEGGSKVMANTAAIGAAAGLTGYDMEPISAVIRENFGKKGQEVVTANLKVATAAYNFAAEKYAAAFPFKLQRRDTAPRMLITGNEALALGAFMAGCQFVAGYPMTPGSPILEWFAAHSKEYGIVIKHAEDEIAAINMVIGAGHMGVRAMTPTSGGGFSLMVEALGLAGMVEVPIVVINVQRPGPATGHATRHEQGDLLFTLYAAQGEFLRVVLAPGTIEQCFEAGYRAFNLAERYQCPAIILSDAFLAHSPRALEQNALNLDVPIDRGALLSEEQLDRLTGRFKRFAVTETGVSPRAIPGHPQAVCAPSSDEHDEYGQICEDAAARIQQHGKRMQKLETARAEMKAPLRYGPPEADLTFLTWGSTIGPLQSAVEMLNQQGQSANIVQIMDIWPLPVGKVTTALQGAKKLISVEQNYGGQLATLVRAYTGIQVHGLINKYDGRPMSPEYILAHLKGVA
ncbi:MAG: 2-oxoacid:acceptor oxidoreductase subunit alpha [Chloroflexi bacterium]|nr:2-oxoacid:acceptor oxidoreductase subunit alpha [Chloroflexota bacterium]